MLVTLNRQHIPFSEHFLTGVLANFVLNLVVFVFPIFNAEYVSMLSMYPEYLFSLTGGGFVIFYIWFKHSRSKKLDFKGEWKKTAKKCAAFGSAGLIVGLFFPFLSELSFGCLNISLFYLFIAPIRKKKRLDTWKVEEWSVEELRSANQDLVKEDNPVLYASVLRELGQRTQN